MALLTIISVLATLFQSIYAIDVAESNTGAVLAFPSVIDGPLFNKSYEVAPAQFGYQRYGGSMEGVLILPKNTTYHKECPPDACSSCDQEPLGTNPYIHYIKDWFISPDDITDYILVIDRLDCYFVDKILHAQQMGASGVVMCDWKYENLFTMWMPQDWTDNIHIPAILLQKSNCETLYSHLGVKFWDPQNIENTLYPDPEHINWTIAMIEWGLPHDDDRVEWELWTSSNDYLGSEFKHNFNTTAIMLDKANDTIFTPHTYILNGSHWGCNTNNLPCKKQCTNSGRYCAVDPEYDLSIGLNGMDVIQENLRSLCVWEYDKQQRGIMDDIMWWDYAVLWDENCGVYSNSSNNFHVNCSYLQMNKLDNTGGLATFVYNCINQSGGYGYHSGDNSILRSETKLKYNSSIYALPMVRVNEFLIHGNIDCKPPVTQHTCEVLAAICAGFKDGTQPDICYVTPSPTIAHCNDTDKDCALECNGQHIIDACNKCLLVSDPLWNECIGCNGQINTTFDCSGQCGGHFAANPCGYCKDTRAADFATFGVDCKGGCDVNLKEDECGECKTESNITWNDCIGCDGVPYSDFKFNPCGRCIDYGRTDFNTFGEDCAGTCDGDARYDECGQCLLESSTEWNNCVDCERIPNGPNKLNQCGFCLNTNIYKDDRFTTYGMDCAGICEGSYKQDECGQCLLPDDNEFDNCCGGDKNKQYNICGLCLYKNTTDFNEKGKDCQGNCEGKFIVDACGHCLDPLDSQFDDCVNCGDNLDLKYDCEGKCGGNAAFNPCGMCLDSDLSNFNTYGQDCAGVCGGQKTKDNCNNCLDSSSTEWNSCIGCDNVPNSGEIENECGVCANPNDVQFDEYGKDCSGQCARVVSEQHYIDECGKCLMVSDPLWNECVDEQKTNTGNNQNNGMITIIVIAAVSLIVVCLALIIIIYLCKKHREMRRTFDEITRTYRPMDDLQTANKNTITVREQETD